MNPARLLLPFTLLLVTACQNAPSADADGDAVAWRPQPQRTPIVVNDEHNAPNVLSPLAPGTRIQLAEPPRATHGIPLPDGSILPGLNGCSRSARVQRPSEQGPVPPVVGIVVDESRFEWYEHADGSMTTSRWVWKPKLRCWEPMTFHAVAAK